LVPLTGETGSGLFPTPTRVYTRENWSPEDLAKRQAEVKAATLAKGKHTTGNGFGLNLAQAVRFMWPTPRAADHKGAVSPLAAGKAVARGWTPNLPEMATASAAGLWPTPTASMFKGSSPASLTRKDGRDRSNDRLDHAVMASDGGQLNPTWVEWLMGFPSGWTDLSPSETP